MSHATYKICKFLKNHPGMQSLNTIVQSTGIRYKTVANLLQRLSKLNPPLVQQSSKQRGVYELIGRTGWLDTIDNQSGIETKAYDIESMPINILGFYSECLVMAELSRRGHFSQRLDPHHDYDLICDNGKRIEVKSSRIKRRYMKKKNYFFEVWRFGNEIPILRNRTITHSSRNRNCELFIFVAFNHSKPLFFIVPKSEVGQTKQIQIANPKNPSRRIMSKYWRYKDAWDLLEE